jgi:hypothetical protein
MADSIARTHETRKVLLRGEYKRFREAFFELEHANPEHPEYTIYGDPQRDTDSHLHRFVGLAREVASQHQGVQCFEQEKPYHFGRMRALAVPGAIHILFDQLLAPPAAFWDAVDDILGWLAGYNFVEIAPSKDHEPPELKLSRAKPGPKPDPDYDRAYQELLKGRTMDDVFDFFCGITNSTFASAARGQEP